MTVLGPHPLEDGVVVVSHPRLPVRRAANGVREAVDAGAVPVGVPQGAARPEVKGGPVRPSAVASSRGRANKTPIRSTRHQYCPHRLLLLEAAVAMRRSGSKLLELRGRGCPIVEVCLAPTTWTLLLADRAATSGMYEARAVKLLVLLAEWLLLLGCEEVAPIVGVVEEAALRRTSAFPVNHSVALHVLAPSSTRVGTQPPRGSRALSLHGDLLLLVLLLQLVRISLLLVHPLFVVHLLLVLHNGVLQLSDPLLVVPLHLVDVLLNRVIHIERLLLQLHLDELSVRLLHLVLVLQRIGSFTQNWALRTSGRHVLDGGIVGIARVEVTSRTCRILVLVGTVVLEGSSAQSGHSTGRGGVCSRRAPVQGPASANELKNRVVVLLVRWDEG